MLKHKILSFMISALLIVAVAAPVSAQESRLDFGLMIVNENGQEVLIDKKENITYYQAFLADGTPIPLEIYMENLKQSRAMEQYVNKEINETTIATNNNIVNSLNYVDFTYYTEKQKWSEYMTPRKASTTVDCRNSAQPCLISQADAIISTESWSAGITGGDKSYVKANASFQWTTSSSSTLTVTLYVPTNKKGYLTFAPKYNFTKGDITYMGCFPYTGCSVFGTKTDVWGASPATIFNGHTDGMWALAFEN